MPIPTRLANDGWWLCERPPTVLACNFSLQTGSAIMADFSSPAPDCRLRSGKHLSRKTGDCCCPGGTGRLVVLRPANRNIAVDLYARADLRFGARQSRDAGRKHKPCWQASSCCLASCPPSRNSTSASLIFILLSLGVGLQLAANRKFERIGQRVSALRDLYLFGPFRFFRDAPGMFSLPA